MIRYVDNPIDESPSIFAYNRTYSFELEDAKDFVLSAISDLIKYQVDSIYGKYRDIDYIKVSKVINVLDDKTEFAYIPLERRTYIWVEFSLVMMFNRNRCVKDFIAFIPQSLDKQVVNEEQFVNYDIHFIRGFMINQIRHALSDEMKEAIDRLMGFI